MEALEEPGKSSLFPWEELIFKALAAPFEMHPAARSIPITFPSRTCLCCSNIKGRLPCSAEPWPGPCSPGYFQGGWGGTWAPRGERWNSLGVKLGFGTIGGDTEVSLG